MDMDTANTFDTTNYALGREIWDRANEMKIFVNVTKMMKLSFICYGVFLAVSEEGVRPLNEQPQMWPYGPVFPDIREWWNEGKPDRKGFCSEKMKGIVQSVLETYGDRSATALVEWSHKVGSPWDVTRKKYGEKWGRVIEDSVIREYFKKNVVVNDD